MAPRRAAGARAAGAGAVAPAEVAGAGPAGVVPPAVLQASPPPQRAATISFDAFIYFSIVMVSEPLIVSGIGLGSWGVVIASVELDVEVAPTSRPSAPM